MVYVNFEAEKSYVIAYNELNKLVRNLEHKKERSPKHFTPELEYELLNFRNGAEIVKSWLEEISDSQMTIKKSGNLKRQLRLLIESLANKPEGTVTASQGLAIDNYIYSAIARIIGASFYAIDFSCSNPAFVRSLGSNFDMSAICDIIWSMISSLEQNPPANYIALEQLVADAIDKLVALFEQRKAPLVINSVANIAWY